MCPNRSFINQSIFNREKYNLNDRYIGDNPLNCCPRENNEIFKFYSQQQDASIQCLISDATIENSGEDLNGAQRICNCKNPRKS